MTNNLKHDFSPAKQFGEIRYVFPTMMSRKYDPQNVIEYVRQTFADATENDYLIPAGDPSLYAVAVVVMLENFGAFTTLRWDKFSNSYEPLVFDFDLEEED
jgi:hypothetical protein